MDEHENRHYRTIHPENQARMASLMSLAEHELYLDELRHIAQRSHPDTWPKSLSEEEQAARAKVFQEEYLEVCRSWYISVMLRADPDWQAGVRESRERLARGEGLDDLKSAREIFDTLRRSVPIHRSWSIITSFVEAGVPRAHGSRLINS